MGGGAGPTHPGDRLMGDPGDSVTVTIGADTSRWNRLWLEEVDRQDRRRVRNADMRDLVVKHAREFQEQLDKVTELMR